MARSSPLIGLLAGSVALEQLTAEEYCLMISEARRSGLLGRLSALYLSPQTLGKYFPESLQIHSKSALVHVEAFQRDVRRELDHIQHALSGLSAPVILLKGAAYVLMGNAAAEGRVFSDIDVLVPKQYIGVAEQALMFNGWVGSKLEPYDQRYYREWSHEIPPMTHRRRGTTIDLHHSLVMPTCRIAVDSEKMIRDAIPVDGCGFWWRLKDEDMLLHAASHLMLNSEFERGLRDLWDIDLLFRQFSKKSKNFADSLIERAQEVGLEKIAQQALSLAKRIFGTPIPDRIVSEQLGVFVCLVGCSASTRHSDTRSPWQGFADALLSYREIYLRLPNRLLAVHLAHKTANLFGRSAKKPLEQTPL
ncbi:MAG: nucleotidyltransferase family protein [Betaproteobacteria bacterium]|nr:nucleotidyltransferase family protein [Betaproteobacteria bacterium]